MENKELVMGDLTLHEAQKQVDASIQSLGGYWPPLANLARLFEECGEVARAVNQLHGPKRRKLGEPEPDLTGELGDTLYVLIALANSLGIDLDASLRTVIEKYHRRDGPTPGTGPSGATTASGSAPPSG
jgi:NTP pyrophosphatase (non-canonical NTP hydrolase)